MDPNQTGRVVDVHLYEYWKLKDEQTKRIEFRDHLIHVHLALVGGAMGWGLTHGEHRVFLLVPWICVITGWTYLVTDDRISALAGYFRRTLAGQMTRATNAPLDHVLVWETEHREDVRRKERKVLQFVVDLLTFICSGLVALFAFIWHAPPQSWLLWALVIAEFGLMLFLGGLFFRYTDFERGGGRPPAPAAAESQLPHANR